MKKAGWNTVTKVLPAGLLPMQCCCSGAVRGTEAGRSRNVLSSRTCPLAPAREICLVRLPMGGSIPAGVICLVRVAGGRLHACPGDLLGGRDFAGSAMGCLPAAHVH